MEGDNYMNTAARHTFALMAFLSLATLRAQPAAPVGGVDPATLINIRGVRFDTVFTPEFSFNQRGMSTQRDGRRQWLRVSSEFETAPEWMDEVTVTFYVVLRANPGNIPEGANPNNLFTGTVTYVNVRRGRHNTTMFLDPNTSDRFGTPQAVAVVYNVGGRPAGGDVQPRSTQESRWWTTMTPNAMPLLNRSETPFALVEIEQFNTVKP